MFFIFLIIYSFDNKHGCTEHGCSCIQYMPLHIQVNFLKLFPAVLEFWEEQVGISAHDRTDKHYWFYHSWSPVVDVSAQVTSAPSASSATRTMTMTVRWSSVLSVTTGSMPSVRTYQVSGALPLILLACKTVLIVYSHGLVHACVCMLFCVSGLIVKWETYSWAVLRITRPKAEQLDIPILEPYLRCTRPGPGCSGNLWWPLIQTGQCRQIFDGYPRY